jgi:hypothetical protein
MSLFTTEPMLTRALAAEIRHDPDALARILIEKIPDLAGTDLRLSDVECEGAERTDIIVTYAGVTVGIEAKVDHEVTDHQLKQEAGVVDRLVLLVDSTLDARGHEDEVAAVLTWSELLDRFTEPRLLISDIKTLPMTKMRVRRTLRRVGMESFLPQDWMVDPGDGDSGAPSIVIHSPVLPDGHQLMGQVQRYGRSTPAPGEPVLFEYYVGCVMGENETDLPENPEDPPFWIKALIILRDEVLANEATRFELRRTSGRNRNSELGRRKMPIVRTFMPDDPWLAHGYIGSAIGPASVVFGESDLDRMSRQAAELFLAWFDVLSTTV